jgi:hypothetical protein
MQRDTAGQSTGNGATAAPSAAAAHAPDTYRLRHAAFAIMSATLPTVAVLVVIGFWSAARGGHVNWDQPVKHGANAAIVLFEVMISRLPATSTWVVFPLTYSTVYTVFMNIYDAIDGDWPYDLANSGQCVHLSGYITVPFLVVVAYFALCAPST